MQDSKPYMQNSGHKQDYLSAMQGSQRRRLTSGWGPQPSLIAGLRQKQLRRTTSYLPKFVVVNCECLFTSTWCFAMQRLCSCISKAAD